MDKYWIWLQNSLKYGNNKVRTVRMLYNNIKDFYNAGEMGWRLCGCFTSKEIENLRSNTLEAAERIIEKCNKLNYYIITPDSEFYPKLLKEIQNPPCVLYVRGDVRCLNSVMPISVVGTRAATRYGKEMAFEIARDMASKGTVVISGGALGIDSAAHEGALSAGGKTVAVLGCGINYPYLLKNSKLRKRISETGAVISEYPPDFPGTPYTFPIRNRIVSGLSLGTLVIEAGEKSGSIITANLANEQNRDVFVVPVDENSSVAKGAIDLIRDGAQVVTCAEDILNNYCIKSVRDIKNNSFYPKYPKEKKLNSEVFSDSENNSENFSDDEFNEKNSVFFNRTLDLDKDLYEEKNEKAVIKKHDKNKNLEAVKNVWADYLEKSFKETDYTQTVPKHKKKEKPHKKEFNDNKKNQKTEIIEGLSEQSKKIYFFLEKHDSHIDDISRELNIPIKNLLPALTELELMGLIKACSGKIYSLNI